ncbi:hypothetical protein NQ314_016585 [Rhamnusium bicolor]|uniref:pyrroline-5-carboxylate reductase n=1 Tax=Rhamnusium bicolor TaxID=1586634 RepID=A0AAV8WVX5_9CUCU|nr:hypothetical protein NQ314_016585 [Rhamnusium bicolor]
MIASCHPSDLPSAKAFKELGAESVFENVPVVQKSDVVIISVKPTIVPVALGDIKKASEDSDIETDKLFLSIAMGITTKQLEKHPFLWLDLEQRKQTLGITKKLLQSVGTCEQVPEGLLDPVTALSGSGPAYIYVLIEALADGGVKMGLPRDLAYRLAAQTVLGAAQMVRDTKIHPGVLKDDVTSPAGSTAAGLHFLEQKGKQLIFIYTTYTW